MPHLIYFHTDSIHVKFLKSYLFKHAATLTKVKAKTTFTKLEEFCKKQRCGPVEPTTITFRQINNYVSNLKQQGLGELSIRNETSIIRRALEGVGRKDFAQITCSNAALEAFVSDRKGKGKVVDPQVLQNAVDNALPNTKAMIGMSRYLGLRIREVVRADESLNEWQKALSQGHAVIVRHGTKGGKVRYVVVAPGNLKKALEAVELGQKVLKFQKYLVVSKNLKSAVEQHSDRLSKLGIKGANSCHSLRRAFAMDQYMHYLAEGCSKKTALSRTSNDLGHGDGRGHWVMSKYIGASLKEQDLHKAKDT